MNRQDSLLEDLGLAPQSHKAYGKKKLYIDKGEIDPRTLGGIALISDSAFNKQGFIRELDLRYWLIYPDGRYEKQHLFQLETHEGKNGKTDIKNLWILGRDVSLHVPGNIDIVLEAIRRIHVSLRDTGAQLPPVATIFKDCNLENIIGESLPLPGFSLQSRIHFSAVPNFNLHAGNRKKPDLYLPQEAFMPLIGMRRNTLDVDHSYVGRDFMRVRGVIPQIGRRFEMSSDFSNSGKKQKGRKLSITQRPADGIASNDNIRLIAAAHWKLADKDKRPTIRIKKFSLMDKTISRFDLRENMAAMGVLNLTHTDMLNARDYPRMQDHLATYGMLDVVSTTSAPPEKEGRVVMTSVGGNNLREIYPGIGEDIGGNCKTVEVQWKDRKSGDIRKVGIILDWGSYLIRQNSEWSAGHPDLVEKLKYCRHSLITHHHIDHLDTLIPYIKRGMLGPDHTLHMTPEVHEMYNIKLNKAGIRKDDPRRPSVVFMQGTNIIDIRDDNNVLRMSVLHGVDAMPHSARNTPCVVYGRHDKQILGSYMYLGDMRYDAEWLKINDSPFWNPAACMLAREPDLDPAHLVPTYTELDGTSIKREGRGATEQDVEDNLTHILTQWFPDKHAGIAIIGTNDGRRETLLRIGNRTGRVMTAFGSAVEDLFKIANKWGVNTHLVDRPDAGQSILDQIAGHGVRPSQVVLGPSSWYTGLKDYLAWHAESIGVSPTEYIQRTGKKARELFEYAQPGRLMAILSGSQGNPVEFESMTYKLADARSFWDADPAKIKTARPARLEQWVVVFAQSAIPGNAAHQKALIKRLASRGATVLEAFDDNLRVLNPGAGRDRIIADLIAAGRIGPAQAQDVIEADGSVFVENYAIHASGHQRNGDMRLWLRKLQSKYFGLCHVDDREAVLTGYDTIEEEGRQHPGAVFENGVEVEITTDTVQSIGKTLSSIVLTREKSEDGKHYNKQLEATRVFNFDDRSPHHEMGLRGSVGGRFETHFGMEDAEDIRRRERKKPALKVIANRSANTEAKPRRTCRGLEPLATPPWDPNHPVLVA